MKAICHIFLKNVVFRCETWIWIKKLTISNWETKFFDPYIEKPTFSIEKLGFSIKLPENGWVFVYKLIGCRFESSCCHLYVAFINNPDCPNRFSFDVHPSTSKFLPGYTSSLWDIFFVGRKVSEEWKETFHLSSCRNMHWAETLHSEKQNQIFWDPISVEKQVTVILYYLPRESRIRKMANSFGIGKLTVSEIIRSILFLH